MRDALPLDLLRALDLFAIERQPDHAFIAVTPPPLWVRQVLSAAETGEPVTLTGIFPFLERFLSDAESIWRRGAVESIQSGPFVAPSGSGDLLLRATALNIGPHSLLVLERIRGEEDLRHVLQTARENKLAMEGLHRQLGGLNAAVSSLGRLVGALRETDLTPAQRDLVDGIGRALDRVQSAAGLQPSVPPQA